MVKLNGNSPYHRLFFSCHCLSPGAPQTLVTYDLLQVELNGNVPLCPFLYQVLHRHSDTVSCMHVLFTATVLFGNSLPSYTHTRRYSYTQISSLDLVRSYFYLRPSILICRCLIDRLRCLPATIIARKLVRPLLRRFVLEEYSACQHVIPYLLTPKSQGSHHPILTSVIRSWEEIVILPCLTLLSDEPEGLLPAALFKKFLVPVICRLFTVREYGIRLFLLKHFRCYSSLIDKSRLEKQIMPLVSW